MANPKSVEDLVLYDGKVLVYQDVIVTKEEVSAAGVVTQLATRPTTKASSGIVVNVAFDISDVTRALFSVGKRVVFSPYSGFAMIIKGDPRYLLLGEHEIFAQYKGEVGDVEIR